VLLAVLAANYFQVAESKIGVSQVIAVSMWLARSFMRGIELLPGCGIPGHQWPPGGLWRINQLGLASYFQVALSQVISGLHRVSIDLKGLG
jgi:hypothetical protein